MRKTILLTGASGVVGQLPADLTPPDLGLDRSRYTDLARRIDAVVHSAAITHFGTCEHAMRSVNISGTRRILGLAEQASVPVYYLSTAFVSRVNQATARPGAAGESSPVEYLKSKIAAEEMIRASGQPAVILRPSVVLGDSVTGRIARYQGLHGILGAIISSRLPLLTMEHHSRVDFVSQDMVAHAVAALVDTGTTSGEYWLTAGRAALAAGHIVDATVRFARGLGLRIDPPRLVCPEVVHRLIRPVFVDALPRPDRRRFEDMYAMTSVFDTVEPFPTDLGAIPGTSAPTPERLATSLHAALRYLVRGKAGIGKGRVA